MINNKKKVELLAPAGDFSCFMAAMNAGADAVYMQILKEDETDQMAMVGMARNSIGRKDYKQAVEIHELTTTTCDMCGGSYAENLDGAISYFVLDGKRFKLAITRV